MTTLSVSTQTTVRGAIVLGALIVAALIYVLVATSEQPIAGYGGEDGKLGGEFTLQGVNGPVSLADFRGKAVILYFGFLNCEEVCLTSMTVLQQALTRLPEEQLEQVRVILISIDPQRDSYEDLAAFTKRYHKNMIGLTGTQRQIDAVTMDYGAYFKITAEDRNDPNYYFRHSSRYYVIDQEGELVDAMRHSTTPRELLARVTELL